MSICGTDEDMMHYHHALLQEIKSTDMNITQKADTIFFGGGTPSVYPQEYIAQLLEQLEQKRMLSEQCEITIEVNPGTVNLEKLKFYKKAGINRLSIGLQSVDDTELRVLGRIHNYKQFLETFYNARNAGFENINIDIMSAVPGQTISSYENTLKTIINLNPEHISAYSLIIEEGTPFYDIYNNDGENNDFSLLPSEEEEREMYYLTKRILSENGYVRYEISNYAKEGYQCRHNLKYWNRDNYYGFGVAAASLVDNVRYKNISNVTSYIELDGDIRKVREEENRLTKQEQMEEFMFLGLRKMNGILYREFENYFNISIEEIYGEVIEKAVKQKLLIQNHQENRIYLSERGIDVSNVVMAEFLLDS